MSSSTARSGDVDVDDSEGTSLDFRAGVLERTILLTIIQSAADFLWHSQEQPSERSGGQESHPISTSLVTCYTNHCLWRDGPMFEIVVKEKKKKKNPRAHDFESIRVPREDVL